MFRLFVVLLGVVAAAVVARPAAAEPHAFTVHDLVAMQRISDHQISPDGLSVAFVVRTTDLEANKGRTDLWRIGIDGGDLRQLTFHPDADTSPRWSADGKSLYFLSTRSGSSQVWRLPADGGEAQQVTKLPLDVDNLVLSTDGRHVAFSIEVFPEAANLDATKKRLDEIAERKATGRTYDRLFIRHWDTWKDGRRSHLFVMPVDGDKPVDVTRGLEMDVPTKPFGGTEELAFTPDGQSIVFTARNAGREEAWSTNTDLFLAPVDGSAPPRCLTEANKAADTYPLFSPDGKTLAYLSMKRPGYEADRYDIHLRGWPDGPDRIFAEDWDRSPDSLAWAANGSMLLATANHLGQNALFAIPVAGGRVATLVPRGHVSAPATSGPIVVYALDSLKGPAELYKMGLDTGMAAKLTHFNDKRMEEAKIGEPEQFEFKGWNDETVFGYMVRPVDFDASRKYPVAFLIHGGPQGSFGNDWHYRWNPQTYAGAGYAAVMIDFHGSTGYGQAFTDSIRGDWGGKPLEDLQKGLAAALAKYPWMDGERVSALGASYGGYMIAWIAGNWPDRFRCLVCHDGNLDEHMAYFDTEELWFPEWEHGGTPWDNPGGYQKHNPVNYVKNWRTPMLVIHGAQDFRVVDTQGISIFTACQRRGIPSKLLHFPDENHWVLKPANSILWHETVLAWLDQWMKESPGQPSGGVPKRTVQTTP